MNSFHKVLIFTIALIVCVVTISVSIVSTIKSIRQLRDETNRICLEQKTNKKTKAVKKDISTVVDDYLTVAERGGIKISKIMIKDNTNAEMDFMFSSYNVKNYFMNNYYQNSDKYLEINNFLDIFQIISKYKI